MRVYVQSKTGNYNTIMVQPAGASLEDVFKALRVFGYYTGIVRDKTIVIPFEEIEYIREATEDD